MGNWFSAAEKQRCTFHFSPLRRKECEVTIEHDIIPLFTASTKYMIRDYHDRGFGVTGYAVRRLRLDQFDDLS